MGIRVLLGALAIGLVLLGSGGAYANKMDGLGVAEAATGALSHVRDLAASLQDTDDHALPAADQSFGGAEQPDTEEVCTILMVLRGQGVTAPPLSSGRHANGPHISENPPVPPPERRAAIVKTSAKKISAGRGAPESQPRIDLTRKLDGCGSLTKNTRKSTSLWDLDDSKGSPLAFGDGGHPDSEVCTVLMVWRGAKPVCAKHARLPKQAPFQSIVPPVPPPQRGEATTTSFASARASEAGSAAARDASLLGPLVTPPPAGCDPLSPKTSSAWDLDDDPEPTWLDGSSSGEPDSEVCTIQMVWRGVKRPIDEDKRLRPQAPALSTGPPVPPPQWRTIANDVAFAYAPGVGRVAVRDFGSRSARYPVNTTFPSFDPLRQDLTSWGRTASHSRALAWATVSNPYQTTITKSSLSKGATPWGTS